MRPDESAGRFAGEVVLGPPEPVKRFPWDGLFLDMDGHYLMQQGLPGGGSRLLIFDARNVAPPAEVSTLVSTSSILAL